RRQTRSKRDRSSDVCSSDLEASIPVYSEGSFFNEIVVKLRTSISKVNEKLLAKGMIGGYDLEQVYPDLENHMLIAVTEIRTKEEIDTFVKELGDING